MPALTNDLPIGTKLVVLDIDRAKFCPYCGHVMKVEYSRNGEYLQTYKTCNVLECDLKLVV